MLMHEKTYNFRIINFRIVGYVAEANETTEEKREKLKVLKKHTPKPEINFVTVGSYFMCGKKIELRHGRFPTIWHFETIDSDESLQPPFKLRNSK